MVFFFHNSEEQVQPKIKIEESLAARRLTLQRGVAMQNDSTPEEGSSGSQGFETNVKPNITTPGT